MVVNVGSKKKQDAKDGTHLPAKGAAVTGTAAAATTATTTLAKIAPNPSHRIRRGPSSTMGKSMVIWVSDFVQLQPIRDKTSDFKLLLFFGPAVSAWSTWLNKSRCV